jgi:hypothetical protein
MNNTRLIAGGLSNGKTQILIRVLATGKDYWLTGKVADRYLSRYVNVEDR